MIASDPLSVSYWQCHISDWELHVRDALILGSTLDGMINPMGFRGDTFNIVAMIPQMSDVE